MTGWASLGLTAAKLSDGRVQQWVTDGNGRIWSTWQDGFDWLYWRSPWTPALPEFSTQQLGVAPLADHRLQFWAVDTGGTIWSCWKSTPEPGAAWTPWTSSWSPTAPPFKATQVAAAPLSDGRLQFWAVDTGGTIWSCWKSTPASNAHWTPWTQAWIIDVPSFQTRSLWASALGDGRLQVWVIDTLGDIRTAFKTTTSSGASWSNWALKFSMQRQEQTNWCWAACACGTSHFYHPDSSWTQCSVANCSLQRATCCQDPGPCNIPWYLDIALQCVGHYDHMTSQAESDATITAQARLGRPLGVRIGWSGGGGHFIMVVGGGPNNMVLVKDPWFGMSYIAYNTLNSSYQGSGTWTHSYFTKR